MFEKFFGDKKEIKKGEESPNPFAESNNREIKEKIDYMQKEGFTKLRRDIEDKYIALEDMAKKRDLEGIKALVSQIEELKESLQRWERFIKLSPEEQLRERDKANYW